MIDKIGYFLKKKCGPVFRCAEFLVGHGVYLRHRGAIRRALTSGHVAGYVVGDAAVIRPLALEDLGQLEGFFKRIDPGQFEYFRPHGFSHNDLKRVLRRPYVLTYGLFVRTEIIGYCLLKLYPGRKAFLGRIVAERYMGCGIGKFFSTYLRWQAAVMGFRARSTISESNIASLESHRSVGQLRIIADLPNGYKLIEFPDDERMLQTPILQIKDKRRSA